MTEASVYDVFGFDSTARVICPDCDEVSPDLDDLGAACDWVDKHQEECPA